jgi:hypothetical protein
MKRVLRALLAAVLPLALGAAFLTTGQAAAAALTRIMDFSAASAFSGVPAGCFATSDGSLWNGQCSSGNLVKSPQEWGNLVRSMYPGHTGAYPRMQVWHGTTDTTLAYPNFGEELDQWTNLHGLSRTPSSTDSPQSSWTRTRYGNTSTRATVEGVSIAGTGHTLPQAGMLAYAISFLGLDAGAGTKSGPLRAVGAGKCLDVPGQSTTTGTRLHIWDCWGGQNQQWTHTATGELTVYSGSSLRCLDAEGGGTGAGTAAIIWSCHGGANQKWRLNADGSITGVQSGLCLEVAGSATANGTSVRLWTCNGQNNQRWTFA